MTSRASSAWRAALAANSVEACGPRGTFIFVPGGEIHREASAGDDGVEALLFRVGEGEVVINTNGPAPG